VDARLKAVGDKVEIRPIMYLALSYDHRVVDCREAVIFRVRIRRDAAFANPQIYEFLEAESMGYVIRCRPTGRCRTRSDTCSTVPSGDRRMRCAATTPASAIRRRVDLGQFRTFREYQIPT